MAGALCQYAYYLLIIAMLMWFTYGPVSVRASVTSRYYAEMDKLN